MNSITTPANASKKLASIIGNFNAKLVSTDAISSKLEALKTSLDQAIRAVQLSPTDEALKAFSTAKAAYDLLASALPDVQGYNPRLQAQRELEAARQRFHEAESGYSAGTVTLDDLEKARKEYAREQDRQLPPDLGSEKEFLARHLETSDFFNELKSSLEELQKRFQKSAHTARQRLASCVSELILNSEDFGTFDLSTQTGKNANRALLIVQALESHASEIGKAITKTRAKSTGSYSPVSSQELLSYLNKSPEDITARFDLK